MSSEDIAIRVEGLSKRYEIYATPRDRLKQFVLPRLQRLLGLAPQRYFKDFWALNEVSFEVRRGETVGIIGRNGSGKSTLLQMICGTLHPSSGSIQIRGRVAALLELGSGFNPEFTGRDNVYMNASVLGLSKEEIDSRYDAIAAFADIGDFIEQPVKTYSSGMMVRLAFAVIAHVDADILVVDEALSVGDAFFTQKCMRFLRTFMKTGTVLFVSHDTASVVNLCNRALLLSRGKVAETGVPKDVIKHYLATLYEDNQSIGAVASNAVDGASDQLDALGRTAEYRDMRQERIDASSLRNDIEVFQFEPEQAGFGTGEAVITSVRLLDPQGQAFSWIVGGEEVVLEIRSLAHQDILQPIVGFQFKDRLGQVVFADNTYMVYEHNPQSVAGGGELLTRFVFRLPVLPSGDYSFTVALADGSQSSHVQHHWMHDALIIRVHASSICQGLVGVPMKLVEMTAC